MKVLFDIGHPAHVHLFRYVIGELQSLGHEVFVVAKKQGVITELLDFYKIEYIPVGEKKTGIFAKLWSYIPVIFKTYKLVKKNRIDVGAGVSMTLPLVGKLTSMKAISLDDDDQKQTPVFAFFANMADIVLTPETLAFEKRNKRHRTHASYHELAYLHPNRFTPDENVLHKLKVKKEEDFFILRFNSFTAHHDINQKGLSYSQKLELLEVLKKYGKVFISTEDMDTDFEAYKLPIGAQEMHSAIYFAKMFVGDSQTMTSEAAVLGTPALKCNSFAGKLSIPNELEQKYQLCYSFQPGDFDKMLDKIENLLETENLKGIWKERRKSMLEDKIDFTPFLSRLIVEQTKR